MVVRPAPSLIFKAQKIYYGNMGQRLGATAHCFCVRGFDPRGPYFFTGQRPVFRAGEQFLRGRWRVSYILLFYRNIPHCSEIQHLAPTEIFSHHSVGFRLIPRFKSISTEFILDFFYSVSLPHVPSLSWPPVERRIELCLYIDVYVIRKGVSKVS